TRRGAVPRGGRDQPCRAGALPPAGLSRGGAATGLLRPSSCAEDRRARHAPRPEMIGTIRLALALAIFAAATPPLALWQVVALRSRAMDQRRAPRLWHRLVTKLLGMRIH